MIREIGRRTRLKNREVEAVLDTLIDVWTEELVAGGRIEIENFFVLTTGEGKSNPSDSGLRLIIRTSKRLHLLLT